MENKSIKEEEANQYKLLDLIPRERKWVLKSEDGGSSSGGGARSHHFSSNEKKLELRLGLSGDEDKEESRLKKREGYNGNYNQTHNPQSVGYFSYVTHNTAIGSCPPWGYAKDSSQPCNDKNKNLSSSSTNTHVPNSSQKRAAPGAVVGWPPVRSFRKNLASSSSTKPPVPINPPQPPPPIKAKENPTENAHKGLFVKINMEGVPIGRKVDLRAYDSYDKLCSVVDTLFRGLLAAQSDSSSRGIQSKQEREKPITGLLDGNGEYTLVYEDNEGDKMLVGDVPWHMFVSTVKRLRVLKSSELPSLSNVGGKQGKQLKKRE